jgi:predicted NAD/FAD-binding protein
VNSSEHQPHRSDGSLDIAVVGSGISGLSAAWLLAQRHRVMLFEQDGRLGGHSNTVVAGQIPVDTGFIVYNEPAYPNLAALFRHLGVSTHASDMSFAVSMDGGRMEYSSGLAGLLAQPANLARPWFWAMLADLVRFYRRSGGGETGRMTLDQFLDREGYGRAFREDHLYPMAAAIWSTSADAIGAYPAAAFLSFCRNHGLLTFTGRPQWRTVAGGSRRYVERLAERIGNNIVTNAALRHVRPAEGRVEVADWRGNTRPFDHVVMACHADQALRLIRDASPLHREVLGPFCYTRNLAVLHSDPALMPRRRGVWSSWNYLSQGAGADRRLTATYWMNRLQKLDTPTNLFLTLNPWRTPRQETVVATEVYEHPVFDLDALAAQRRLWSLQGQDGLWFCGAYFGFGFHEDGLQSGLAVAEALGGVRRPWTVAGESERIYIDDIARVRLPESALAR